jgi:uncharacterized protein YhbP (UPF0306 family)
MSPPDPAALAAAARDILAANLYMTIATADAAGTPWATPVYFTAADATARELYWVSSPDARHSRNLAERAEVALVVFDSRVLVGHATAVYLSGTAAEVAGEELAEGARVYGGRGHGGRYFAPEELRGDADLRLYRATVGEQFLLARAGDPAFGRVVDGRVAVDLGAAA